MLVLFLPFLAISFVVRNVLVSCLDSDELMVEQIHIALGKTPDYMTLQWATSSCAKLPSVVYYGSSFPLSQISIGRKYEFDVGNDQRKQCNHVAELSSLLPSTKYYYRIGDSSTAFWFISAADSTTLTSNLPQKFLIFGDLGTKEPENTATVMPWTSREVQNGGVDIILQVGDFAYDLESEGGEVGRLFMNEIQNMSAFVPYMVLPGNHESGYNFAHYTEFFRNQPSIEGSTVKTDNGIAPNNWYFSWNVGLVHFVVLSTEIYFYYPELIEAQWKWLENDLKVASGNRTSAPWIIVSGHRNIYCSCGSDCDDDATKIRAGVLQSDGITYQFGLEQLLYKYKVDIWINGHLHAYERMFDVEPNETYDHNAGVTTRTTINPPGTIYIVTGNAGNEENHGEFAYAQPAYRSSNYGYNRMSVYNSTHLHWEQVQCDLSVDPQADGIVADEFWLIQTSHM